MRRPTGFENVNRLTGAGGYTPAHGAFAPFYVQIPTSVR
jgi:hypothetical protein